MAAIATSSLYSAQHPGWNYETTPYTINDMPQPLPARSEMLPSERKEALEKERQEYNVSEIQRAYDEGARQRARGGFFNKMGAAMKPRWAKLRSTPMPVREAIPSKRDERRFNSKFHFPSYERLIYASELCKVSSGNQQILGKVYVSENFFCFRESRLQPKGGRRQRLLLVIPIDDILSIAMAEITAQPDPKYTPEFRVLDQWQSKADGLFLYTRDFKIHRFFGFWTQQTYHDTFNVLDRQWRSRPFTSTQPLRSSGMMQSTRSMNPPINNAAPSVALLEPAVFQPQGSSISRSLPVTEPAVATFTPSESLDSSTRSIGKQSGEIRRLPVALQSSIRQFSLQRLRRITPPSPRYGYVLAELGNGRLEMLELDTWGQQSSSSSQRFGLSSQGRQFRRPQYTPKRASSQRLPQGLSSEIQSLDKGRLRHVATRDWLSSVPLGRVVEQQQQRPASFARQGSNYVQRDRLGFQTVQQKLHAQQRGRAVDSQLKDEIRYFNLRSMNHVEPEVHQWLPSASDIKMRPRGQASETHHRHHHHRHHHADKKKTTEVYQYEEYAMTTPTKFERIAVTKLQPGAPIAILPPATFEAGTA